MLVDSLVSYLVKYLFTYARLGIFTAMKIQIVPPCSRHITTRWHNPEDPRPEFVTYFSWDSNELQTEVPFYRSIHVASSPSS